VTPRQRYQRDLKQGLIQADPAQHDAVDLLEALYFELMDARRAPDPKLSKRLLSIFGGQPENPPRGVYLWGNVGRGKTYLMDIFYDCLPFPDRLRTHFHRFMQRVHYDLKELKGEKNPLSQVAAAIAAETSVLCFDEFYVSDIGDAMILSGLLQALFGKGVVMLATSNVKPELLYENGLQRDRFIPAIRLLQEKLTVFHLDGDTDYRLRSLSQAELYHWPLGQQAENALQENLRQLAPDFSEGVQNAAIEILGRTIVSRYCADDVVWFEFADLCGGPRSVHDYIEIARIYHAVLLGNMPVLEAGLDDEARRFINLVDELYDRGVKLIISAQVPIDELYRGTALTKEFQRTRSRLLEMQSHQYLARPHRP